MDVKQEIYDKYKVKVSQSEQELQKRCPHIGYVSFSQTFNDVSVTIDDSLGIHELKVVLEISKQLQSEYETLSKQMEELNNG